MSVDPDRIWYDLRFGPMDMRRWGTSLREPRRRVSRPLERTLSADELLEMRIRAQEDQDRWEARTRTD